MNTITIVENPLDSSTWKDHQVSDVATFIADYFKIWPKTAHIYIDHIAKNSDITPYDQYGIERLGKINGHFYVVVYPDGIETILLIVALAVGAVAVGLSFLFRPSVNTKNQQESSANNQLSDRQNQARPNQRIPDIFGQLWATFDLLAVPYRTFVSNIEIEHCYMCIGRGDYSINAGDIRDDITPLNQIDGCQAAVYGPNSSPNGGAGPILTIGSAPAEPIINLKPFGAVNGQSLGAPNLKTFLGNANVRFVSPNKIFLHNAGAGGQYDFTQYFTTADPITVGGIVTGDDLATDGSTTVSLAGTYPASSITFDTITLSSPATINANWSALAGFSGSQSTNGNNNIQVLTQLQTGPYVLLNPQMTQLWFNFLASQGLFEIDKDGNQLSLSIVISVTTQQCDTVGALIGSPTTYTATIVGTKTDRNIKGTTLKIVLPAGYAANGGVVVTAKRTTNTDRRQGYSVVDQIQWRDLYIISPVTQTNFGNITSIQTIIRPTPQALAVKERKMNALVTRKVPSYTGGTSFGALTASKNAADIICAMALDPFIGRRTVSEIDVVGIYALAGSGGTIQMYFGVFGFVSAPTEFCYAFDDSKVSFEESVSDIATAIFCQAYRRGNKLELSFEQQTSSSVLLFNHRNKIPKSETRTVSFGLQNDNDGITLTYVEPNAPNYPNLDTQVTLYFPQDQSAINPKKIDTIGIRNVKQATLLGWRSYKKLLYQNMAVQFEATEEAALLVLQNRIMVADNTRSDTQDGEVLDQTVLQLTLSQKVTFDARFNYTIFLQLSDGSVQSIPITAGATDHQVILGHAPDIACVTTVDNYAKTTYMIVHDGPVRKSACLLAEKTPKDGKIYEIKAVNYDSEYYNHDTDFKSNVNIAQEILEVVTVSPSPHADIAQVILEVVTQ